MKVNVKAKSSKKKSSHVPIKSPPLQLDGIEEDEEVRDMWRKLDIEPDSPELGLGAACLTAGSSSSTSGDDVGGAASSSTSKGSTSFKLIQKQLVLLLHSHACLKKDFIQPHRSPQCCVPKCAMMKEVWFHIKQCSLGSSCPHKHCESSLNIISHWKNCKNLDCCVCKLVRIKGAQQLQVEEEDLILLHEESRRRERDARKRNKGAEQVPRPESTSSSSSSSCGRMLSLVEQLLASEGLPYFTPEEQDYLDTYSIASSSSARRSTPTKNHLQQQPRRRDPALTLSVENLYQELMNQAGNLQASDPVGTLDLHSYDNNGDPNSLQFRHPLMHHQLHRRQYSSGEEEEGSFPDDGHNNSHHQLHLSDGSSGSSFLTQPSSSSASSDFEPSSSSSTNASNGIPNGTRHGRTSSPAPTARDVRAAYERLGIPCPVDALRRLMATLPGGTEELDGDDNSEDNQYEDDDDAVESISDELYNLRHSFDADEDERAREEGYHLQDDSDHDYTPNCSNLPYFK